MTVTEEPSSANIEKKGEHNNGKKKEERCDDFGQFTHFVYTNDGNTEYASVAVHRSNYKWILDSGATKHVTGNLNEFETYTLFLSTHSETIQTADGTAQQIKGVGSVECTQDINLSSVLHVPAFPVNLVSLSALIDQLDCCIMINKRACLIQESLTRRKIGSGTMHRGLWYLDQDKSRQAVFAATSVE
jgi:hypothetical protein